MANFLVTGVGGPAGGNVTALLLERCRQVVGVDMRLLQPPWRTQRHTCLNRSPPSSDYGHAIGMPPKRHRNRSTVSGVPIMSPG